MIRFLPGMCWMSLPRCSWVTCNCTRPALCVSRSFCFFTPRPRRSSTVSCENASLWLPAGVLAYVPHLSLRARSSSYTLTHNAQTRRQTASRTEEECPNCQFVPVELRRKWLTSPALTQAHRKAVTRACGPPSVRCVSHRSCMHCTTRKLKVVDVLS